MPKIGLCGAQGTGKSTLAREISNYFDLPMITEQARTAAHMLGLASPKDCSGNPQLGVAYQQLCLSLQVGAESSLDSFVSDRTTADNALYWMKWQSHNVDSVTNLQYYDTCRKNMVNYDLVIYVPPEFDPPDDGFRSTSKSYQGEMDFLLRCLLGEMRSPLAGGYMTVRGDVQQRLWQVVQKLEVIGK